MAAATAARAGRVVVVGGGASGYFAAVSARRHGAADVLLIEATRKPLKKVLASGGGRCNVLHDPSLPVADFVERYPRGRRELRGPYSKLFGPEDAKRWFEAEGVALKTEADGRVFPTTDSSETIAAALRDAARTAGVRTKEGVAVTGVSVENGRFAVATKDSSSEAADAVIIATGSAPAGYGLATALGHTVEAPCPSLFSFRVQSPVLEGLAGLSLEDAVLELRDRPKGPRPPTRGPLLVTHRGLSGPAALRLSAFRARDLRERAYKGALVLDALPDASPAAVRAALDGHKKANGKALAAGSSRPYEQIPKRLWARLAARAGVREDDRWAGLSSPTLDKLAAGLKRLELDFDGKDTNKDEFTTAGGVALNEVDMKSFMSKRVPGLHFAGELLDVDGVTGGFNFMHCWCSGFAAGASAARVAEGCEPFS